MSRYLLKVDETYRVDSEAEAAALIDEAKKDNTFELMKYSSVQRNLKQKGEIIESWYRVTLTKGFDEEKEPCRSVIATYEEDGAF